MANPLDPHAAAVLEATGLDDGGTLKTADGQPLAKALARSSRRARRRAFLLVVIPCLRKGLLAALFLSLSFLLGEFVFANMLVGTRYETLQVYLYNMRATSGHFTSALVMSYFLLTLLLTWAANRFHR